MATFEQKQNLLTPAQEFQSLARLYQNGYITTLVDPYGNTLNPAYLPLIFAQTGSTSFAQAFENAWVASAQAVQSGTASSTQSAFFYDAKTLPDVKYEVMYNGITQDLVPSSSPLVAGIPSSSPTPSVSPSPTPTPSPTPSTSPTSSGTTYTNTVNLQLSSTPYSGTSANDLFQGYYGANANGVSGYVTASNLVINTSGGTDGLVLQLPTAVSSATGTIGSSVTSAYFIADGAGGTLSMANFPSTLTTIGNTYSGIFSNGALILSNVPAAPTSVYYGGAASFTVNPVATAFASAVSATIYLNDVTGNPTLTLQQLSGAASYSGLTINSTGSLQNVLTLTAAGPTSLTITGTQGVNLATVPSTLTSISASGFTGTGTTSLTGIVVSAIPSTVATLTAGTGYEEYRFSSIPSAITKFTGTGTTALGIAGASLATLVSLAASGTFTNFGKIILTTSTVAAGTYNIYGISSSITALQHEFLNTNAVIYTLAESTTIYTGNPSTTYGVAQNFLYAGGTSTYNLFTDTTNDYMTLNLNFEQSAGIFSAPMIENLSVVLNQGLCKLGGLVAAGGTSTITLTGNYGLTIQGTGFITAEAINASGLTLASNTATGLTMSQTSTGAGAISSVAQITGSMGIDTIVGTYGPDQLIGGLGADVIWNQVPHYVFSAATAVPSAALTYADKIWLGTSSSTASSPTDAGVYFNSVALFGSVAGTATSYAGAPVIKDFKVGTTLGQTDILYVGSGMVAGTYTDYSTVSANKKFGAGIAAHTAVAPGSTVVTTLSSTAGSTAATGATVQLVKLLNQATFTTNVQTTYAAAMATSTLTALTAGDTDMFVSYYDSTAGVTSSTGLMVLLYVDGAGANTVNTVVGTALEIDPGDSVYLVGTINMSYTDYTNFGTNNYGILAV